MFIQLFNSLTKKSCLKTTNKIKNVYSIINDISNNINNNNNNMDKKVRYSIDEIAELFLKSYPYLIPTKQAVGRFAKRQGFTMMKQMIQGKLIRFYVKKENV